MHASLRALVFLTLSSASLAAQVPQPMLSGLHWRDVGPMRGGRSYGVAGSPSQPDTFYFGSVGGGVWKTVNAGHTWLPISDDPVTGIPIGSIGAIAVAPSNPSIIYVGTGEPDIRAQHSYGIGMYKSTDEGTTWSPIGLTKSEHIGRIVVDPRDPNRVYVAALGSAYAPSQERGVYRSTDGGKTWKKVLFKQDDPTNVGAIELAIDPKNPRVIYGSLWATRRPPWSVYAPSYMPGSGLYKSHRRRRHLEAAIRRPAQRSLRRQDRHRRLELQPQTPLGCRRRHWRPRSARNRRRWQQTPNPPSSHPAESSSQTTPAAPGAKSTTKPAFGAAAGTSNPSPSIPFNPDSAYVINTATYRTVDAGKSWVPVKGAPGGDDYHQLWVNPNDPNRMVLSSDQGTVVSVDKATSWSTWYNQPTAEIYHVAADNRFPLLALRSPAGLRRRRRLHLVPRRSSQLPQLGAHLPRRRIRHRHPRPQRRQHPLRQRRRPLRSGPQYLRLARRPAPTA